jgi:hypothetical protein
MFYRFRRVALAGTRLLSFGANGTGAWVPIGKWCITHPNLALEK